MLDNQPGILLGRTEIAFIRPALARRWASLSWAVACRDQTLWALRRMSCKCTSAHP